MGSAETPILAVVAGPDFDAAAAAWLEAIRRAHDPLQDRIGPHVTLMLPTATADVAALLRQLEAMAAEMVAFDVAFDRLSRMDDPDRPKYRFLNVLLADAASAARLTLLHRALTGSTEAYAPHLTISRFGAVYSAKALERQLGSIGPPLLGRVGALELLRIESGAIRSEASFALTV